MNEQKNNIAASPSRISEAEFNNINSNNLIGYINIPNITYSEKSQLRVASGSFRKDSPYISFQLTDGRQTSDTISV